MKRDCDKHSANYRSDLAQRKYAFRQKTKNKHKHFTDELRERSKELLKEDFSPEQVVGVLKKKVKIQFL